MKIITESKNKVNEKVKEKNGFFSALKKTLLTEAAMLTIASSLMVTGPNSDLLGQSTPYQNSIEKSEIGVEYRQESFGMGEEDNGVDPPDPKKSFSNFDVKLKLKIKQFGLEARYDSTSEIGSSKTSQDTPVENTENEENNSIMPYLHFGSGSLGFGYLDKKILYYTGSEAGYLIYHSNPLDGHCNGICLAFNPNIFNIPLEFGYYNIKGDLRGSTFVFASFLGSYDEEDKIKLGETNYRIAVPIVVKDTKVNSGLLDSMMGKSDGVRIVFTPFLVSNKRNELIDSTAESSMSILENSRLSHIFSERVWNSQYNIITDKLSCGFELSLKSYGADNGGYGDLELNTGLLLRSKKVRVYESGILANETNMDPDLFFKIGFVVRCNYFTSDQND